MEILILINSILLIIVVLLQSGKADGASGVISGGNENLFANRKERGTELFITRVTIFLGVSFFLLALIQGF